jgi:hypothetical protein
VGFAVQLFSSPNGGRVGNFNRFWPKVLAERANFDCEPARRDELTETLQIWFGKWLKSLQESAGPRPARFPAEIGPTPAERPFRADFIELAAISGPLSTLRSPVAGCCIRGPHLA